MKVKTALISFLPLLFFSPIVALAAPEDFVITEIMYNPNGSDEASKKEWVEVYHNATVSADIAGGSAAGSLRFNDNNESTGHNHTFKDSGSVAAHSYFIIARSSVTFKSQYPSYSGQIFEVSMSLGNSSNVLAFCCETDGTFFSASTYDSSWGNKEGWTLERKDVFGPGDSTNWVQSSVEGGTPGEAYKEPEKVTYPDTVKINEVLPDPKSKDDKEWVELYNSSAGKTAVLTNWQMDDIEGGSSPQTFSAEVPPLGYYVYYFSSNILNNDGDTARLVRPDGVISDSFNYIKSTKDYSYALVSGVFSQTSKPTPGEANILAGNPDLFEGSIPDIKKLPLGHAISLSALVCVPENLLGDKELYVCDKDTGIRIYYSQTLSQSLTVGDKIRVSSTVEESNDERYIKTDKVDLVQTQVGNVEERRILTGEISEPNEGSLVRISGKMEEQSGGTFYLNDRSGAAKVYIKESTGIIKPKMAVGDEVRVIGVVSQYGYLKSGDGNYRLLPRFQSDIYNLTEGNKVEEKILGASTNLAQLPLTGISGDAYTIGWILIFLGLSGRVWIISKRGVLKY